MEPPSKHHRLLPGLLAALCNLMVKALLMKTTLTYTIEPREAESVPTQLTLVPGSGHQ